ncbi:MAG: hypothetical protein ABSC23_07450 [Bryobacteraceae bacterium]
MDQPLFSEGGVFPILIIVLATIASVAGWALVIGAFAARHAARWKLCVQCMIVVALSWAVPLLARSAPDALVAPLIDDWTGLFWAVLPFALLGGVVGRAIDGRRGMMWVAGTGLAALVLCILRPFPERIARWALGRTDLSMLMLRYDNEAAPPIFQTLNHQYWRAGAWIVILVFWSVCIGATGYALLRSQREGKGAKELPFHGSRIAARLWPKPADKLADWFVILAGLYALYTACLYRAEFAGFRNPSLPWALSFGLFVFLGLRSWRALDSTPRRKFRLLPILRVCMAGVCSCYVVMRPGLMDLGGSTPMYAFFGLLVFVLLTLVFSLAALLRLLLSLRRSRRVRASLPSAF